MQNGQQVFVISWRNPDARHSAWGLDTYVMAVLDALERRRADLRWPFQSQTSQPHVSVQACTWTGVAQHARARRETGQWNEADPVVAH